MRRLVPVVTVAALALGGCATRAAVRPSPPPAPLAAAAPPADVAHQVGWGDAHPLTLAAAWWEPDRGGERLQAVVLERVADERKEVIVALLRDGRVAGVVPLARIPSGAGKKRSVGATLGELPLGDGDRALRVDVRTFEGGEAQLFAVKTTLVALAGERPVRLLDRLVESGDRMRDRRADLSVKDVDGDGTPELVVEERESGPAPPRTLVYRRGPDGRFVTRDRSIFEE
jgi:hypothetical protein